MTISRDSQPMSQEHGEPPSTTEKRPYEPPMIERDEEFERVMLACCTDPGGVAKGEEQIVGTSS